MDPISLPNIFSGDAFSVVQLTENINMVPNSYGRVSELGIFTEKGINTPIAALEINNGVLNLIPKSDRGTPAPKNKSGKRKMKHFEIPRFALDDYILPADIAGVREFGSMNLKTAESVTNDKLVELAGKHDITHEFLKCGAINGLVVDSSGETIVDIFAEFGLTQKNVAINFATANSVRAKVMDIKRTMKKQLMGDTMTRVHALCSPEYFDKLLSSDDVKRAYDNYLTAQAAIIGMGMAAANPLRDDVREGFVWQGCFWEEYPGEATALQEDGTTVTKEFIASGEAAFFPIGTKDTFVEWHAPADWMETVNTVGLKKYAKVVPEQGGRHVEVLSQSLVLPMCKRPGVLIKGTLTNS